ncbi:MAG: MFS transporter [Ruminococcaceae bacterium]|nr:MFS transporter [Oscillospiraceae bacterium]
MSIKSNNFKRTKYTCYFTYLAMSTVFSLPPLLFVTFRETYGVSYTLLGTLVLVNFCTQLAVDLVFSFFSKYFNIHKVIKIMPLFTAIGLLIYALIPTLFPQYAYIGLLIGTVVFSVTSGLCEVFLSPIVAALPSDNPERDMSMLHSLYAYGVVAVIVISTVFFMIFGTAKWMYLTIFWALLPIISFILFSISPLPELNISNNSNSNSVKSKNIGLTLCVLCIFFGGAAENIMTNWVSGYMENALEIPKTVGDVLGMAVFAILLGIGRTTYAKYGKNISTVLLCSMIGATLCYIIAGVSANNILCILACVFTGLFTSMLWPGTLILLEEKFVNPGIVAYALMAAGGDFGSSIAPQAIGIVIDTVSESDFAIKVGEALSLTCEQVGMKTGMLVASLFPLLGIIVLICIKKHFSKNTKF